MAPKRRVFLGSGLASALGLGAVGFSKTDALAMPEPCVEVVCNFNGNEACEEAFHGSTECHWFAMESCTDSTTGQFCYFQWLDEFVPCMCP
jgi:hypothetical protein